MTTISTISTAINPFGLEEGTKLRHKKGHGIYSYDFDLCYREYLLWSPWVGSYYRPDDFELEEFEIISEEEYRRRERTWERN